MNKNPAILQLFPDCKDEYETTLDRMASVMAEFCMQFDIDKSALTPTTVLYEATADIAELVYDKIRAYSDNSKK